MFLILGGLFATLPAGLALAETMEAPAMEAAPATSDSGTTTTTTPDPAELRDAAHRSFLRLMEEKRYPEAIDIAGQLLDMTRQLDDEALLATPLTNLGTAEMRSGDHDAAMRSYAAAIDILERHEGIASARLINPLAGLGEAALRAGLYPTAIEAYERALHVNHATTGFYNLEQLPILDGLSEAFLGIDRIDRANARQRSQITIRRRHAPDDIDALVQAMQKLARWYAHTGQYQASESTYQEARRVIRRDGGKEDPRLIDTLLGEAKSYQGEGELPSAVIVLKRALSLVDAQPEPDPAKRAEVLVALGDLHILARQPRTAQQHYSAAWQELSADEELLHVRKGYFALPLRIAGPVLPRVVDEAGKARAASITNPGGYEQGLVAAALTVTAQGRSADVKIIESSPPGLLDQKLLKALASTVFRPAMVDGEPVDWPDLPYRHEFRHPPLVDAGSASTSDHSPPTAGKKGAPITRPGAAADTKDRDEET